MEIPELYVIRREPWQFFATLTFTSEKMSTARRMKMYFAWLRQITKPFRIFFPSLPWALRLEDGELTGRRHMHALIAGFDPALWNEKTCFFMMHSWETLGGGMARVRKFNPALAGADYLTKDLKEFYGGDVYELNKFGSELVQQLTLSTGLVESLRRRMQDKHVQLSPEERRAYGSYIRRMRAGGR